MLDSATWYINEDSIRANIPLDSNDYYPLSEHDSIWTQAKWRAIIVEQGIIWRDLCYIKVIHIIEKSLTLLFMKLNKEMHILI